MSFIARLFSRKQQKSQQPNSTRAVYTHEEGDFVHINSVRTADNDADEEADVSKWEMAQVLGRFDPSVEHKDEKMPRFQAYRAVKSTPSIRERYVDDRYVIEEPSELDMFDDKLNRVLKRSHRRRANFPDKPIF